ncbi:hypothetical protein SAMN05443550_103270 [Pedobacter hartonius]|uniref:Uncharacterized protein n=1 Tax=Pedobacter hartonius TaxID=425514 RepID=A0A1H4BAL5_9SPHI|nr:hypothetical protein SAMN05443550_103270 [Pedobacter hartonius]
MRLTFTVQPVDYSSQFLQAGNCMLLPHEQRSGRTDVKPKKPSLPIAGGVYMNVLYRHLRIIKQPDSYRHQYDNLHL